MALLPSLVRGVDDQPKLRGLLVIRQRSLPRSRRTRVVLAAVGLQLAYRLERRAHLPEAARPDGLVPVALHLAQRVERRAHGRRAPRGRADQLRAPVPRIGDTLEIAEPLELVDMLADRLRRLPGAVGEFPQPHPARLEEPEDAVVRRAHTLEARRAHSPLDRRDEAPVDVFEQLL